MERSRTELELLHTSLTEAMIIKEQALNNSNPAYYHFWNTSDTLSRMASLKIKIQSFLLASKK